MDKYIHVPIKDLLSNPFRRVEHYPIRREKVEALKESIERTGFWDNLLVRPAKNGKYERAFGEHRSAAINELFSPNRKVGVIVREISDEDMIRIMARENMEEWGKTSGIVEMETVHSVVQAYADGKITLVVPPPSSNATVVRSAPLFAPEKTVPFFQIKKPYTISSIVNFLGWQENKIEDMLTGLQFIADGILNTEVFVGLSVTQVAATIESTRLKYRENIKAAKAAEKEAEEAAKEVRSATKREATAKTVADKAKASEARASAQARKTAAEASAQTSRKRAKEVAEKVGHGVSKAIKAGDIGYREAFDLADQIVYTDHNKPKDIPLAETYVKKLAWNIFEILKQDFDPEQNVWKRLLNRGMRSTRRN